MRYYQPGQIRLGFGRGLTPVIKWLIIANVAMFVIQALDRSGTVTNYLGLSPQAVLTGPMIWQVFTYQFLHGGFFHIFFNMFVLWMFGTEVEMTLSSRRFLKFYLICGTGAGIITVLTMFSVPMLVIGASGAVLGVLVAFAVMFPNRVVYLYFLFPIKVKYLVMILIAIDLLAAWSGGGGDGVAHFTHLGGALIGFIYMKPDWKIFSLGRKVRGLRDNLKYKQQKKRQQNNDRLMEEVDQILDKISEVGYENLSEREKKILKNASNKLSQRKD
jgi:membrane associated rhomboid family serine protease